VDVGIRVDRIMSFGSPIIGICFDATYIGIYVYGFAKYDGGRPPGQRSISRASSPALNMRCS
jgi:hypothetical protein